MGDGKKSDLKKIEELVQLMHDKGLVEIEIVDGDNKIHLKRPGAEPQAVVVPAATPAAPVRNGTANGTAQPAAPAVDEGLVDIKSPIVGTYYAAPSPDAEPYVKAGDHVTNDTVVCIVEAMKVINEIKAETAGTIEKIMVSNGQAVEFGQVLFKIKPD
ncbi:MAG: acetyl-CoA carboxylase biotin carboxyl carrier protein [Sedimentisphaerales bacterium]|nr:acetyl-CoA carboxylase biotin carboxyl carrier protein [Sedimentisphaerales bacterium]